MRYGHGLRRARRRSFTSRRQSISLAQFAAGELEKNVVQAGSFERDVLDANWQFEQLLQTLGWMSFVLRGNHELLITLLNHPKPIVKATPLIRVRVFQITF